MDKHEIRAENVSIGCLLRTLKKNLWMIAAAAAIFAMLVSLYADFVRKPVYRASMTYAVTSRMSGYSPRNITAAKEMASILTEVLDNRIVNDTIRASSDELSGYSGGIKAKLVENSSFVVVTSESGSQREAFLALVALMDNFDTFSDYISSNIAKSLLDAPVIAMLGHEKGAGKKKRRGAGAILINSPAVSLAYTEQINSLCSRIEHEKREKGGGIVLVTSVGANEGKSTVAANIAISLASRGYKVALIDADLRNPSQTELFGGRWSSQLPFNKMLAKPFSVEALNTCAKYDAETNVMMLFSQYSDERCTELLSSETMRRSIERLRRLDFVVIDTPPMGMFPDAELLCDMADQSMLVVRQDTIPAADINDCVDALNNSSAHFLGCILNDMHGSDGGYGYGYGRGYGYGKKYGYYGNYKKETGSTDGRMKG